MFQFTLLQKVISLQSWKTSPNAKKRRKLLPRQAALIDLSPDAIIVQEN